MIISTWNVNSIKVRIHAVLQYLEEFNPDVLVLQETKSTDDNFPIDTITDAGGASSIAGFVDTTGGGTTTGRSTAGPSAGATGRTASFSAIVTDSNP